MIMTVAAFPVSAQQIGGNATGVTNHVKLAAAPRFEDNGSRGCRTPCTTAVGAVLGAGIGAGATYLYNTNKDAAERSIADGPAVALMAILGGIAGALVGFLYGRSQ